MGEQEITTEETPEGQWVPVEGFQPVTLCEGMTIYPSDPNRFIKERRFEAGLDRIDLGKLYRRLDEELRLDGPRVTREELAAIRMANGLRKDRRVTWRGVLIANGHYGNPGEQNQKLEVHRSRPLRWIFELSFTLKNFVLHWRWRFRCWKNDWPLEPFEITLVEGE